MANMESVNGKIAIDDIRNFEKTYNVKLPEDYIAFLLKYNGGYPKESTFKISDEEGESVVNKFYGIGNMKSNLSSVFEILDGEIPDGFISIANDPGGNEICISVGEEHYGKVFVWIHDMDSDEYLSNMFLLANSFNEFFDNLYENES